MYTGCHCPVTSGQKGGGVWEMDIRDPPWAQANFPPPQRAQWSYATYNESLADVIFYLSCFFYVCLPL